MFATTEFRLNFVNILDWQATILISSEFKLGKQFAKINFVNSLKFY